MSKALAATISAPSMAMASARGARPTDWFDILFTPSRTRSVRSEGGAALVGGASGRPVY